MKHLVITGDDFGKSHQANEAIEHYHREGLLTQASLMVNEDYVEEAVRIAKRNPSLRVGLHLTLCDGVASSISKLTDAQKQFNPSSFRAGINYAFNSQLKNDLKKEITAQCEIFHTLGFESVYWDGHTHLHLHPVVRDISVPVLADYGFRVVRLLHEPEHRALVPLIFRQLSRIALPQLAQYSVHYLDKVLGLKNTGRMGTGEFEDLAALISDDWSEIYFHPGAESHPLDIGRIKTLLHEKGFLLSESMAFLKEVASADVLPSQIAD